MSARQGKTVTPFSDLKEIAEALCEKGSKRTLSDWEEVFWERRVEAYRAGEITSKANMTMDQARAATEKLGLDPEDIAYGRQRSHGGAWKTVARFSEQFVNGCRIVSEHAD